MLDKANARIAELEEEVARLKKLAIVEWMPYEKLPLTGHERKVVGLLLRAGVVTNAAITETLWGDRADGGPDNPGDHIKVLVCKLRKKLAALNVSIRTLYGVGYTIPASDRDLLERVSPEQVFNAMKEFARKPLPRKPKVERPARGVPRGDRPGAGKWSWK